LILRSPKIFPAGTGFSLPKLYNKFCDDYGFPVYATTGYVGPDVFSYDNYQGNTVTMGSFSCHN